MTFKSDYLRGLSLAAIAAKHNTYPNRIRRALLREGVKLRDASEAQSVAIREGRAIPPMKGKHWGQKDKISLSEKRRASWKRLTQKERKQISSACKERWEQWSEEEKETFRKLGVEGIRRAAQHGSRLEHGLLNGLQVRGYVVDFHPRFVTEGRYVHIDLVLPKEMIAIEVDGPSHFKPLWGKERLKDVRAVDKLKNGLLLQAGYHVIRIKCLRKRISPAFLNEVLTGALSMIDCIKSCVTLPSIHLLDIEGVE